MSKEINEQTAPDQELTARADDLVNCFNEARRSQTAPLIKVRVGEDGHGQTVAPAHPDKMVGFMLLKEATGASDAMFLNGILEQLTASATVGGVIDEAKLNFMLSIIRSLKPKDQIEAMMASQMAVVHVALMRTTPRMANAYSALEEESATRTLNNLARTFAIQVDALKRHRSGGEQKIIVQQVSASEPSNLPGSSPQANARRNTARAHRTMPKAAQPFPAATAAAVSVVSTASQTSSPTVENDASHGRKL